MGKLPNNLKVYDPSSIKVRLTNANGKQFELYGFAHDLKIAHVRTGLLFRFQSLSDTVKVLMNSQGEQFTFSINGDGDFKEYLSQFDGVKGTLELEEAEVFCSEVPTVTFKLEY